SAAKLLTQLEDSVRHLRLLIKLYKIPQRDLERLLKPYKRDLDFAFLWPLGEGKTKKKLSAHLPGSAPLANEI
ncbi:MAG: hypothetical protein J6Y94_05765, partial [Bacteriovoracaceae bacterium]|nr:hypothetical protein [Bacteriovoracaceae bacterium]